MELQSTRAGLIASETAVLAVKDGECVYLASDTGLWPSRAFTARDGRAFRIPQVMLRKN